MNNKVGFTIRFLKYHTNLFFRCCSSARGVEFAYQKPFFDNMDDEPQPLHYDFRKLCYEALFYYMVGLEWENLGSNTHTSLVIGDEVDETLLAEYDLHCHQTLLPPSRPKKVTGLVGDGHHKVLVKRYGTEVAENKRHVGRSREDGNENRGHGHGWFMLIDHSCSRIVGVVRQDELEGSKVVTASLLKKLALLPEG